MYKILPRQQPSIQILSPSDILSGFFHWQARRVQGPFPAQEDAELQFSEAVLAELWIALQQPSAELVGLQSGRLLN